MGVSVFHKTLFTTQAAGRFGLRAIVCQPSTLAYLSYFHTPNMRGG